MLRLEEIKAHAIKTGKELRSAKESSKEASRLFSLSTSEFILWENTYLSESARAFRIRLNSGGVASGC